MIRKVGIYRDPRKAKPWIARWSGLPDEDSGKRRYYSQSFALKSEAEKFAVKCRIWLGSQKGWAVEMIGKVGVYRDPRKTKPWIIRWSGLPDVDTGKRRRYSRSFAKKYQAEKYAAKLTLKFIEGAQQRDRDEEVTLKQLCRDYIDAKRAAHRAPRTIKAIEETCTRLIAHFGDNRPVCQIRPAAAEKFITKLQPMRGKSLSDWSRDKILRNSLAMFNKAVKWHWTASNPFAHVERPKLTLRDWQYITPQQYQQLIDTTPSLRWKAILALAYMAGLRFAELFSLTWGDIDFKASMVQIRPRDGVVNAPPFDPKTKESIRTVPLTRHTLDILLELRKSKSLKAGPFVVLSPRQYQTLVAKWERCRQQGRPWEGQMTVNNVPRDFGVHLDRAEIKRQPGKTLSFHTLRKCAGKNWADRIRNPKVVQRLMGHSSLTTTMKYYSKLTDDDMKKAADVIDELLGKSDAKVTPSGLTA